MENKSYLSTITGAIKSLGTGMGVTFREYFTPKITEQYPENRKTTLHVAERHRGRLTMPHDEEGNNKCVACQLCQNVCPNGSITVLFDNVVDENGRKKRVLTDYRYDLGDCMFCELCVNICAHDAIKFDNKFENAVFDRSKLVYSLNIKKPASAQPQQPEQNAAQPVAPGVQQKPVAEAEPKQEEDQ
jgi:NADH-quinone oxidoreductase subunit I